MLRPWLRFEGPQFEVSYFGHHGSRSLKSFRSAFAQHDYKVHLKKALKAGIEKKPLLEGGTVRISQKLVVMPKNI